MIVLFICEKICFSPAKVEQFRIMVVNETNKSLTEMPKTTIQSDNPEAFERLMRLGTVSKAQGDIRLAHEYWRDAAVLQPERVEVWKALLEILEDDDDRRVCLQNILALEPENRVMRQELTTLNEQNPEKPSFLNVERTQTMRKAPLRRPAPQQNTPRWYGKILQYAGEIVLVVIITLLLLNFQQIVDLLQSVIGLP